MRLLRVIFVALLGLAPALRAAAQTGSAGAPAAAEQAPLFPTREPAFDIPFQIDEPIPGQEPVEVQLHVSEDRGASWRQHAKVSPGEGRFSYRAPRDGEFWFLVRTLNKVGRLLPDKPFAAELRVLVDTEPPRLELRCTLGESGEITCTWKTSDAQLKPETLELTYQGVDAAVGRQRVVVAPSQSGSDGAWTGRAAFTPASARPPYYVRVEVSDGVGNRATAEQQVAGPGTASTNPTALPVANGPADSAGDGSGRRAVPFASQGRPPAADGRHDDSAGTPAGRPWPAVTSPPPAPAVPPREAIGPPRPDGSAAPAAGEPLPPAMPQTFPGGRPLAPWGEGVPSRTAPNSRYTPASTSGRSSGDRPGPYSPAVTRSTETLTARPGEPEALPPPEAGASPSPIASSPIASASSSNTPRDAGPSTAEGPQFGGSQFGGSQYGGSQYGGGGGPYVGPTPSNDGSGPTPSGSSADAIGSTNPPEGFRPRSVNSRRFELDYDIEAVGPAGVAKVELWGTDDGGRTWRLFGVDPDTTSPYLVSVEREGEFGFRMVIETTTGLRSSPPQPGDLPEIRIGVDVTKPTARIKSALPGTGEQAGELVIQWEAADAALAPRPIALAFSDRIDGPWTTIASGLPNQGQYAWRLDNRVPERLYLKLDVRDEAGNIGSYVTPEVVSLLRVKPQGKIRGVRPIGESARLRLPAEIPPR